MTEAIKPILTSGQSLLFQRPWIFIKGVPAMHFLPPEGPPEIAFAGRSNVGKSSLINALTGQNGLARTSNTPGRTQELNFFVPDGYTGAMDDLPPMTLVDMPGYGYAEAPKDQVEKWTNLVFSYLRGRVSLKRVFLLIDSRHGVKANDEDVLKLLDKAAVSYQIVLTKADKLHISKIEPLVAATLEKIRKRPAAFPEVLVTSSEKNAGLDGVHAAIFKAIDSSPVKTSPIKTSPVNNSPVKPHQA